VRQGGREGGKEGGREGGTVRKKVLVLGAQKPGKEHGGKANIERPLKREG
jgi:hypothetical protein